MQQLPPRARPDPASPLDPGGIYHRPTFDSTAWLAVILVLLLVALYAWSHWFG